MGNELDLISEELLDIEKTVLPDETEIIEVKEEKKSKDKQLNYQGGISVYKKINTVTNECESIIFADKKSINTDLYNYVLHATNCDFASAIVNRKRLIDDGYSENVDYNINDENTRSVLLTLDELVKPSKKTPDDRDCNTFKVTPDASKSNELESYVFTNLQIGNRKLKHTNDVYEYLAPSASNSILTDDQLNSHLGRLVVFKKISILDGTFDSLLFTDIIPMNDEEYSYIYLKEIKNVSHAFETYMEYLNNGLCSNFIFKVGREDKIVKISKGYKRFILGAKGIEEQDIKPVEKIWKAPQSMNQPIFNDIMPFQEIVTEERKFFDDEIDF